MKKTMKKITCATLAAVSVFGCAATMAACETSHPEVQIEITFNDETYTLDYTLYRKTAPATVAHFLCLADNGYYDGLAVHDYEKAQRLYTGAYSVSDDDATNLVYKKYYDEVKEYESFAHSVWSDDKKENELYTLKGEFEDNNVTVKSGALQESFGSLAMYYENIDVDSIANTKVYSVSASEEDSVNKGNYQYNHATSAFFISLTTTSKTNNNYCTFATLNEDSTDTLKALQTAIDEYIAENYSDEEESFTEEVSVKLFEDDTMFENSTQEANYDVPKAPIVISKVKVNKF